MAQLETADTAEPTPPRGGGAKYLALTAMVFAVAMTFIDQTIVSIAAPNIQHELSLSSGGVQWVVNGYRSASHRQARASFLLLGGRQEFPGPVAS